MASTFASYFGLRSTLAFTATGQPIPAGHMYAVSSNVGPIWTNTLTVSSFSTLIGSSITISTLTVSSINGLLSLSTVSSIATSSIGVTTGNIRIGTINSAAKLHITTLDSTSVSTNVLSFVNTGGGYGIYANSIGIAARGNTLDWYSNDYNSGVVTTRPVLTMRPEGAVGIGITNPERTLHINGTFTCNNPIFSVVRSGTFSIASATATRVPYNVVDFDTNSGWNNSTFQYKPTVAGYYQFSWCVIINALTAGGTQEFFAPIYKNGTTYAWGNGFLPSTVHYSSTNGSCILYLNGTTDYVEIFVVQHSGGSVIGNPDNNFPMRFTGYMLRS